jgi:hypothetical protein
MNLNTISFAYQGKANKPKHCNKVGKSKRDKTLKQTITWRHHKSEIVNTRASSLLPQCAYEWGEGTSSEKNDLYKNWRPPHLLAHFGGACCLNRGFASQVEAGVQITCTRDSRNYNSKVSAKEFSISCQRNWFRSRGRRGSQLSGFGERAGDDAG